MEFGKFLELWPLNVMGGEETSQLSGILGQTGGVADLAAAVPSVSPLSLSPLSSLSASIPLLPGFAFDLTWLWEESIAARGEKKHIRAC